MTLQSHLTYLLLATISKCCIVFEVFENEIVNGFFSLYFSFLNIQSLLMCYSCTWVALILCEQKSSGSPANDFIFLSVLFFFFSLCFIVSKLFCFFFLLIFERQVTLYYLMMIDGVYIMFHSLNFYAFFVVVVFLCCSIFWLGIYFE